MQLISWNVNGIRAMLRKGFLDWLDERQPDILCLQETKAHLAALPPELKVQEGYHLTYEIGERKGYSGTSTWSRRQPKDVKHGIEKGAAFDREGRILHHQFPDFHLFNVYFPNGKKDAERLQYKLDFYEAFQERCQDLLNQGEAIVVCGDVNTAHKEIDLARPKENRKTSGFLPEECAWMDRFLDAGFIDCYRHLYPDEVCYSWWSMRSGARQRNVGWRLDYFFISENLLPVLKDCRMYTEDMGSDHCPVMLELDL